jgi:hypothetical protein
MLVGVAYAALTNTYDTSTPGGGDDPREADDRMREIKAATQERMNDHNGETDEGDHYWPLTGTQVSDEDTGQHRMVTIRQLSDNPSTLTSYATTTDLGFLYQKNDTDNGELFWQDEADNVLQLTTDGTWKAGTITGNVPITGTLGVTGETTLTGGLAATTMSGALAMGSNPITGIEAADATGEAVHFGQWKFNNVAAAVASGGNSSIGSMAFPNGVIVKWGSIATGGTSDTTVTFAAAFPEACFQGFGCGGSSLVGNGETQVHTISKTAMVVRNTNHNDITTVRWFAVGR